LTSWELKKLSDVCEVIMGQSPPGNTYNKNGTGLPFFQGKTDFGSFYPTPSTWCTKPKKIAEPNDILISVRAPVGPTNMCNLRCCIGRGLTAIRTKDKINPKFVLYYLRSVEADITSMGTGSTFQAISKSQIANLEIPLAPVPVQNLIVSEIEKQFSRLDEAVAALKRVRASLKRYKASVLKAAVEGKLVTSEQKKWKTTTVGEVSEVVTKGSSPNWQGFEYSSEGVVFVRSQNVSWGHLDLSDVAHLPLAFNKKEKKSVLRTGDVLLNIVGASIGRAAVATKSIEGGNINQAVAVIRPLRDRLLPQFLMCYFLSEKVQKLIHAQKVDVARANYSLDQIRKLPLHLPPLDDQHRIVEEIESRLSVTEEIEEAIDINLKRAERLRQAILKKAFSGRLVS